MDYDPIDFAVGTYRDVVQTGLLSVEEYASSTNESVAEVKRRIENAGMILEFLEYLRLPEKYHVAREYQVYSLCQEMAAPLKQLNEDEKKQLKTIAFNNTIMQAIPDQRKFIRDIKGLIKSGMYESYFEEQEKWGQILSSKYADADIHDKVDIDRFAANNSDITEELQLSMERALLKARSQQLKTKPSENVSKSISLMMEVDSRQFSRMNTEERETLKAGLDELAKIVDGFRNLL